MFPEYNLLRDMIFETTQKKPVIFINGGGNWGDAVIRAGTLKFFHENSISYSEIAFRNIFYKSDIKSKTVKDFVKDKVMIFNGGGAWCGWFNTGSMFIREFHHYFRKVVVLPSTFANVPLNADNVLYYCRDRYESKEFVPEAIFCHDMAFYLGRISQSKNCKSAGNFFRTDKESSLKREIPHNNIDLSMLGNELTPIDSFVSVINEYGTIYTDRLHVAIVACLLGKKVFLYPSKYFKNESVFKSSIKGNFENVTFNR
jgi:exopolysaccharide biosynthesis predicted pyruvyltransferase EpsI